MITIIHTLNLASITRHTNSPRVRLRRPPRARPQPLLGRHCPPRCCAVRRARRSCARPLARPSSQRAARPSSAIHRSARLPPRARPQLTRPPPGAPPATSATPDAHAAPSPAASAAAAHLAAAARLPLSAQVPRQSARPPVLATRCPTIARHPPPGVPPAASATPAAARPPPAARRAAGHKRDARRRCQSRETVAVLRSSVAVDGEKGIHANKNFLLCVHFVKLLERRIF